MGNVGNGVVELWDIVDTGVVELWDIVDKGVGNLWNIVDTGVIELWDTVGCSTSLMQVKMKTLQVQQKGNIVDAGQNENASGPARGGRRW